MRRKLPTDQVDKILGAFAPAATEVLQAATPGRLVSTAATRIAMLALRPYGLKARPLSVNALAVNAVFVSLTAATGGIPAEGEAVEWIRRGAWSTSRGETSIESTDGSWNGHVVCVINDRWIVDAAAGLLADPDHMIVVPPVVVGDAERRLRGKRAVQYTLSDGVKLLYTPRPADRGFARSAEFAAGAGNTAVAAAIRGRM